MKHLQDYAKRAKLGKEEVIAWENKLLEQTEKILHLGEGSKEGDESIVIGGKGKRLISNDDQQDAKRKRLELEFKLQQTRRKAEQELFQAQLDERRR